MVGFPCVPLGCAFLAYPLPRFEISLLDLDAFQKSLGRILAADQLRVLFTPFGGQFTSEGLVDLKIAIPFVEFVEIVGLAFDVGIGGDKKTGCSCSYSILIKSSSTSSVT